MSSLTQIFKLSDLQPGLEAQLIGSDIEFSGISTDSRSIEPGNLFVALRGDNFDGHQFIERAIQKGAVALVTDHRIEPKLVSDEKEIPQLVVTDTTLALGGIGQYIRHVFTGPLVAITGSCGKTSVKGLLKSIFEQVGNTYATPGNFNNHIGVPLTLSKLTSEHQYAVIEMGASAVSEIHYLTHLARPTIALVNNVRPAHVSGFGSVDAIAKEKGQIYSSLAAQTGVAIINLDDTYANDYLSNTASHQQIGFSRKVTIYNAAGHNTAAIPVVTAKNMTINAQGCAAFALGFHEQTHKVELAVPGEHFVDNALAAAACAFAAGISISDIATGLAAYQGEAGRMQIVSTRYPHQQATLVDDAYNANPGSVKVAIDYLARFSKSSRLPSTLVLGDMGELGAEEVQEHQAIGRYAQSTGVTELIGIGPLSEHAVTAFNGSGQHFSDCEQALSLILERLQQPGVILLKGSRSSNVNRLVALINTAATTSPLENNPPC